VTGIPIYSPTVISSLLKGQLRACYETFSPRNLSNVVSSYPAERTCWQSKYQVHQVHQSIVRAILNVQLRAFYETFGPELLPWLVTSTGLRARWDLTNTDVSNRLVTKRPAQLSCSEPPGTPSEPRSRIC